MDEIEHLRQSIEALHDCIAAHEAAIAVSESFEGQSVWEGEVHAFTLTGHPKAKRAYAWTSPIEGSDRRKVFAVLELPPVKSAVDAVRASIVAEHQSAKRPLGFVQCRIGGREVFRGDYHNEIEAEGLERQCRAQEGEPIRIPYV